MKKTNLKESWIEEDRNMQPSMPSLWHLIYHEAVRSNHLLFSKTDLVAFEKEGRRTIFKSKTGDKDTDEISKIMTEILSCSELSSARTRIDNLSYRQRRAVYLVYRRFIESWRLFYKNGLH